MTDLPILTVSQLTNAIKMSVESTFPLVYLQGEISNFKIQSSGHLYFSLKDSGAQIGAVMFRGDAAAIKGAPKEGSQVIVRGELNVYPPSGKYQIVVRELRLVGLGELLLKLEELKTKLHQKGWFSSSRKKNLPKLPKTIGVVTSPTGAAIQDILNILSRRFSGFQLILNPVKVQGEGAAQEIAQAINEFNRYQLADVLIVGRGGGSIEDLWAFNEEIVAEAIFNSKIPIISAVGHETDHCIADYVADVRAPTPSAAAEIVIAEKSHHLQFLAQVQRRLHQALQHLVRKDWQRLEGIKRHPIFRSPYALLGQPMQQLDDMRLRLDPAIEQYFQKKHLLLEGVKKQLNALKPTFQIHNFRQKIHHFDKSLKDSFQRKVLLHKERLENLHQMLQSVNPKNLLKKGYAILFSEKNQSVITSVQGVEKEHEIKMILSDGEVLAKVKKITAKVAK